MLAKLFLCYILVEKTIVMVNRSSFDTSSDTEVVDFDELGNITLSEEDVLPYISVLDSKNGMKPADFNPY